MGASGEADLQGSTKREYFISTSREADTKVTFGILPLGLTMPHVARHETYIKPHNAFGNKKHFIALGYNTVWCTSLAGDNEWKCSWDSLVPPHPTRDLIGWALFRPKALTLSLCWAKRIQTVPLCEDD